MRRPTLARPLILAAALIFATKAFARTAPELLSDKVSSHGAVGPSVDLAPRTPEPYPRENVVKAAPPASAPAALAGEAILAAVLRDQPEDAAPWFFPAAPFEALKDIPEPNAYYSQLVNWYFADIRRAHDRLKKSGPLTFEGFKLGYCVWKDVGSEYNKIPYWSCYHSKIIVSSRAGREAFEIRTMINWGRVWYVTHLGHWTKT